MNSEDKPMTIGHNAVIGEELRSYVERVEALRAQKKALAQDEAAVMAEAKAATAATAGRGG